MLEFRSPACSEENLERNASDLERFLVLLGAATPMRVGQLSGPFKVRGGGKIPTGMPLFIGKAIREVGGSAV